MQETLISLTFRYFHIMVHCKVKILKVQGRETFQAMSKGKKTIDWDKYFLRLQKKSIKDSEQKGEAFVVYRGERMTFSDALCYAGVSYLADFLALLEEAASPDNSCLKSENNVLLSLVAHSGIQAAIWLVRQRERLGIDLNVQDKFRRGDNNKSFIHQQWVKAMGMDDQVDQFGWGRGRYLRNTALILACKKGWDHRDTDAMPTDPTMGELVIALLKHGADPNIQDGCGNTALHIAMLHRDYRAIKVLLKNGAMLDIKNNGDLIPEDLLNVNYEDIDPFLYHQTGGDVNCYIHTLAGKRNWESLFLLQTERVIEAHKSLLSCEGSKMSKRSASLAPR